jgi:hypothetical protein
MKHDGASALENARKTLHDPASSLPDLVTASAVVEQVARQAAVAMDSELASRERALTSSARASDLEATLRAADETIAGFKRRLEIAQSTSKALIRRIDAMREAEATRERRERYDAAVENSIRVAAASARRSPKWAP